MPDGRYFPYTYGLSFPGSIHDPILGMIDFREVVRQIADRMKAQCGNKPKLVLYDHFHKGLFARPELDMFLPAEYLKCELVVVFLCKDYADKSWCAKEWTIIQQLAADRDHRHRVMYLWRGKLEEQVLQRLGLDRSTRSGSGRLIANFGPAELLTAA